MMLTRRIVSAGVCAAIAGGALMAGGSSAMAATPAADHHRAPGATAGAESRGTARQPTDPWIADQLATFYPSAARRQAVFDPWIKDQLARWYPGR
ncbi:hypothetical protein GCM10010521_17390 [Streptomyces rameus]|uniref:Uncharacterized protein n=1 Tax=Streptomyces rameus TaxID=68261 RepID=A0ABP6N004_9ACTN